MSEHTFLKGKHLHLRPLLEKDADGPYPGWFNDEDVCYGNMHHQFPYSRSAAMEYIHQATTGTQHLIQAIILAKGRTHIGNIALDGINYINRSANLSIIIGDKSCWGKGYAKEACRLICDHGFMSLNLNRIACGTIEINTAMRKLAEFLGMSEEGRRREAVFKQGRYMDIVEYGVLRDDYISQFGDSVEP